MIIFTFVLAAGFAIYQFRKEIIAFLKEMW